jgi:hypothetical protein
MKGNASDSEGKPGTVAANYCRICIVQGAEIKMRGCEFRNILLSEKSNTIRSGLPQKKGRRKFFSLSFFSGDCGFHKMPEIRRYNSPSKRSRIQFGGFCIPFSACDMRRRPFCHLPSDLYYFDLKQAQII